MLELFGDKLFMNGRHILTLPPGFEPADRMVLQTLLERTERDELPDPPELSDLAHWGCVLDPKGKLYVMYSDMPALPLPDGWKQFYVVNFDDLKKYTDQLF